MESVGLKPEGIGSIPVSCPTKDSSVGVEQVTLKSSGRGFESRSKRSVSA